MKKNYVSNSTESVRMFRSDLMEALSKVHFSIPLIIYIPVVGFFIFKAFKGGISLSHFALLFLAGLAMWTATEYILHRFIFHYMPTSAWGKKIHFIFHGVHHDYPRDVKRLVMPPSASIPLATLFYFFFSIIFAYKPDLFSFFPGFLLGYLVYDILHYALHHYNFKSSLMKKVKQHHMLHHYDDATRGFGVSSTLWDHVLHSNFIAAEKKVTEESAA